MPGLETDRQPLAAFEATRVTEPVPGSGIDIIAPVNFDHNDLTDIIPSDSNNIPLPLAHWPYDQPCNSRLIAESSINPDSIDVITNLVDEGYRSMLDKALLFESDNDGDHHKNNPMLSHACIPSLQGSLFPLDTLTENQQPEGSEPLTSPPLPAANTHPLPGFSPPLLMLSSPPLTRDWNFLWATQDNLPACQSDKCPEAADRITASEAMPPHDHRLLPDKPTFTELQPRVPFTRETFTKNKQAVRRRAARSLQLAPEQLNEIADGTGGIVYRCTHPDQTDEAIKFHFNHDHPDRPPREITILKDLSGTRYAAIKAHLAEFAGAFFCPREQLWFHKMPFYPASLTELLRDCPKGLPEPLAWQLTSDLLNGLAELNRLGYMHRDIKPENLLLKPSFWHSLHATGSLDIRAQDLPRPPWLVITDFGLAKKTNGSEARPHTPHMTTYQYRPAYTANGYYDVSIDVSSTGMVFFQLITGRPFITKRPEKRPQQETRQARELRKAKDQKMLENEIRQRLTEGHGFQKTQRGSHANHWRAWLKTTGNDQDHYPISQYCGLFYQVYGKDCWRDYLQQPSSIPGNKLSPQGFIALCDLLTSARERDRVFAKPDDAALQLQKPYWRNPPERKDIREPVESTDRLAEQSETSTDTPLTDASDLTSMADKLEDALSEQEKLLDLQEEIENWNDRLKQVCPYCPGKTFNNAGKLLQHLKKHQPCPVPECQHRPMSSKAMYRHVYKCHPPSADGTLKKKLLRYRNHTTGNITNRQTRLLRMLAGFTCWYKVNDSDYCGYFYPGYSDMKRHQRTHTGEKPYICQTCNKKFARNTHLGRHQSVHTGKQKKR